jgi:hypothetical protein
MPKTAESSWGALLENVDAEDSAESSWGALLEIVNVEDSAEVGL